ncbi:ASKHA domain-containing protein [Parablautia muri]|uniref:DUF4445 domain-containing protein n=1 Tax=Parablautia muri TaxID=2320879 RepID=A0A9X5GQR2_9FIRM|nr:ASKHA domain-containing protein [Parablautia muri]NBJ92483.1 DUF4445 domain-containing protein [Parablautia muri]
MEGLKNKCPGCKRISCNGCGIFQKLNTNKQAKIQFPESFQIEHGTGLGISFDVGTTTVAGMLWDLEQGSLLGVETGANPQAAFGADVISRIKAAVEQEDSLHRMQELLVKKLDEMALRMVRQLCTEDWPGAEDWFYKKNRSETVDGQEIRGEKGKACIRKVSVVGNTAMCEIFMGIKPVKLSGAPFTPDYRNRIFLEGKKLGFHFLQDAVFTVLPPIGGYVGADALAVYSYVNQAEQNRRILAVDIGTNGEIILEYDGEKYACSAAAGPALEGGAISCGMRAAKGAIDMVALNGSFPVQDIVCRVIGGGPAVGICGSGLIDGVALLCKVGVIDRTGYMRSRQEAKNAGVSEKICRRIDERNEKRRFLLTDERAPVYLEAEDVRQLQLSVSAIRSGMEILLGKVNRKASELDRLYLAGAFGCYIEIESGIAIGLFPDIPRELFFQAGNLAGTGAAMALLSEKTLERMEQESSKITHVELAEEDVFRELFLKHMSLRALP